ncbi:hypothetical protein PFISCL1PPCAC_8971, partial [Pristionchus fissidentatus]
STEVGAESMVRVLHRTFSPVPSIQMYVAWHFVGCGGMPRNWSTTAVPSGMRAWYCSCVILRVSDCVARVVGSRSERTSENGDAIVTPPLGGACMEEEAVEQQQEVPQSPPAPRVPIRDNATPPHRNRPEVNDRNKESPKAYYLPNQFELLAVPVPQVPIGPPSPILQGTMYSLRPKAIDFDTMWSSLEPSIIDIIMLKPISNKQWNFMFGDIYEICVAIPDPLTDRLYNAVKEALERHANTQYEKLSDINSAELLGEYHRLWKVYHAGARYVHSLFRYLNRQYAKSRKTADPNAMPDYQNFAMYIHEPETKEIGSLALEIWRTRVMVPLLQKLTSLLLAAIADDREGKTVGDPGVVAGVIQSFVQVEESYGSDFVAIIPQDKPKINFEFYRQSFENKFLENTKVFYGQLADKLLEKMDCSQYMRTVIGKLEEEEKRTHRFCPTITLAHATKICQEVMIERHKERLHAVAPDLIENEKTEDLRNMFLLLKPLPSGLALLVAEFEKYVKRKGHEAVGALQGDTVPQQFVERVLAVHEKYAAMKDEVFMQNPEFSGALDKALQAVVNVREDNKKGPPKASERLARYTDMLLRKSVKGLTEEEMECSLSKAIIIFRYIEDKDVFQKYYQKMLSQRLILSLSGNMDAEELMITKLKNACGYEFTSKLNRMFTDIGLSKDLGAKFKEYLVEKEIKAGPAMTPFVLQAGAWPIASTPNAAIPANNDSDNPTPQISFVVPPVLSDCAQAFQAFYVNNHNGRKLTWLWHLSNVDVKLGYADKPYIVVMSVHQMALLYCFSEVDSTTIQSLEEQTKLTGELLQRNVKALTESGLLGVDKKMPLTESLPLTTVLTINKGIQNKKIKFKVSVPQMQRQQEKESEHVNTTVHQDRKYYMECAIVRIMKTRKVLRHATLVQEVIEQTRTRFSPDIPFIKKSIEDLIEKMYLTRTDTHDEYQYLA